MVMPVAVNFFTVCLGLSLCFLFSNAHGDQSSSSKNDLSASTSSNSLLLRLAHNDSLGLPLRTKENGNYTGPMIAIMDELSRRTNIPFEYVPQPFARTWEMVKKGAAIDGGFGNYHTAKREQQALYFYPALGFYYNRLYANSAIERLPSNLDEIGSKTVIKLIGHSISKEFDKALALSKFKVVEVNSYKSMIVHILPNVNMDSGRS